MLTWTITARDVWTADLPYEMNGDRRINIRRNTAGNHIASLDESGNYLSQGLSLEHTQHRCLAWLAERILHDANNEVHPMAEAILNEIEDLHEIAP